MKNSSVEVTQKHLLLGNAMSWSFLLATITCTNMFTNKDVIKQLELIDRTSLLLIKKATEDLGIQTTNVEDYVVKAGNTYKYSIPLVLPTWMKHGNDHRFCETNIGVSALQNTRKKFNSLRTCNVHGWNIGYNHHQAIGVGFKRCCNAPYSDSRQHYS